MDNIRDNLDNSFQKNPLLVATENFVDQIANLVINKIPATIDVEVLKNEVDKIITSFTATQLPDIVTDLLNNGIYDTHIQHSMSDIDSRLDDIESSINISDIDSRVDDVESSLQDIADILRRF